MINFRKQKLFLIFGLLLGVLSLALIFLPLVAEAGGLVPCGGYNANGTLEPVCDVKYAFAMVATVTNWLISVAAIYAVYQIVNSGFWLVVTMGNEESISKYKKALTEAVVGFVFVMLAYVLINTAVNWILLGGPDAHTIVVQLSNPLNFVNPSAAK